MLKGKLIYKVLGIIAATMCVGFASLGIIAIWIEYHATMNLQANNSRTQAAVIVKNISDSMMRGDVREIEEYVKDLKDKRYVRDLTVFNTEGKRSNSASTEINPVIMQAIAAGKIQEHVRKEQGIHTMVAAIPLANEERCKKCHDAAPRFLGGILLDTSL